MRTLLSFFIFLFTSPCLFPLTITVAPIDYYTEDTQNPGIINFQTELYESLQVDSHWEDLEFIILETAVSSPRSFLDAMQVCDEYELDYLLYGFMEQKNYSLYGEIKLFDKLRREVIRVFYSSDNVNMQRRLVEDLAKKIENYFSEVLKMGPPRAEVLPEQGIFSFSIAGGYWPVITPAWHQILLPLYSADVRAGFIPWRPVEGIAAPYFKTGLAFSFQHGINQPGQETYNLFSFSAGIPLELCLNPGTGHSLSVGIIPQFSIDYLITERFFDCTVSYYSWLFSATLDVSYQFYFNRHFALGISNRIPVQFIIPARISYNPSLVFEYFLNPLSGGIQDEK